MRPRPRKEILPEYETLKFKSVNAEPIKVKVTVTYEIDPSYLTTDNGHIRLSEKTSSIKEIIINLLGKTLFDDSWGKLSASEYALNSIEVNPNLTKAFEEYAKNYFELKNAFEAKANAEKIAKLESELNYLKRNAK